MIRILFADDQIPESDKPDSGIDTLEMEMRNAVQQLKDAGYDVDVARTLAEAIDKVKKTHYDIAIIDLGWGFDRDVPHSEQDGAGFKICEAVRQANEALLASKPTERRMKPTFQIMYSMKFLENTRLSLRAASFGALPIYKDFSKESNEALVAVVNFVDKNVIKILEEDRQKIVDLVMQRLGMSLEWERKWFNLTYAFVAASVALLLVGVITVIFGNLQVGTLSSIGSIISGVISSLLLRQFKKSQESTKEKIEDAFEKIVMPKIESELKRDS